MRPSPFCHDRTERRVPCPKDHAEQKSGYSGKKKYHSIKKPVADQCVADDPVLNDTFAGSGHTTRLANNGIAYPLPKHV